MFSLSAVFQVFLPDHEAIIAIRLVQCLASIMTAYLANRLATRIAGSASAGIVAAALLTLHPAFIIEPSQIGTETLYIFFLAMGLWLYTEYVAGLSEGSGTGACIEWVQPAFLRCRRPRLDWRP